MDDRPPDIERLDTLGSLPQKAGMPTARATGQRTLRSRKWGHGTRCVCPCHECLEGAEEGRERHSTGPHLRPVEVPQQTCWFFLNSAVAIPADLSGAAPPAWTHFPPSSSIVEEQQPRDDTANALNRRKLCCALRSGVLQVETALRACPPVIGRHSYS
jgi:hypothetical protein